MKEERKEEVEEEEEGQDITLNKYTIYMKTLDL